MHHEDRFEIFKEWFVKNGGLIKDLQFPAKIGSTEHIGVKAKKDLRRNEVIMGIPKKIIISEQTVRQSQLGEILSRYKLLKDDENEETDFNMLALFLIMQEMKGKKSFYAPYIECLGVPETVMQWSDEQIRCLADPYISVSFVEELRKQLRPIYTQFVKIVQQNKLLFSQELTQQIFYRNYGHVMTRCFGWGLPQTMIVPFADFLNHDAHGVHHYTFSPSLEHTQHPLYIRKKQELNLSLFPSFQQPKYAVGCLLDQREQFIVSHTEVILNNVEVISKERIEEHYLERNPLSCEEKEICLLTIRKQELKQKYEVTQLYESTDSEDNDSQEDLEDLPSAETVGTSLKAQMTRRVEWLRIEKAMKELKEERFDQPTPKANSQFEDGVDFSWWNQTQDAYFIVSVNRSISKGQQVCNSYGRRTNRFLLAWYGFTLKNNKYDSVPFRVWGQEVQSLSDKVLFTSYPCEEDYLKGVLVGNQRFTFLALSAQFRLKKQRISLEVLAFIRWNMTKEKGKITPDPIRPILAVEHSVLLTYRLYLHHLRDAYALQIDRQWSNTSYFRKCFGNFLIKSTKSIVYTHIVGIDNLLRIVYQVTQKKSKSTLIQHWKLLSFQQKMFLREYFISLSKESFKDQ